MIQPHVALASAQTKKIQVDSTWTMRSTPVAPWGHFPFFSARYYPVKATAPAGRCASLPRCSKGHFSTCFPTADNFDFFLHQIREQGIPLDFTLDTRLSTLFPDFLRNIFKAIVQSDHMIIDKYICMR